MYDGGTISSGSMYPRSSSCRKLEWCDICGCDCGCGRGRVNEGVEMGVNGEDSVDDSVSRLERGGR